MIADDKFEVHPSIARFHEASSMSLKGAIDTPNLPSSP